MDRLRKQFRGRVAVGDEKSLAHGLDRVATVYGLLGADAAGAGYNGKKMHDKNVK